jgi:hypothetical protein
MQPKVVIRERYDVLEEDKSQTFRHDVASAPIGGTSGNLFFIGMEGSGRRALAKLSAVRLGLALVEADSSDALESILAGSNQAVAVTGKDLSAPGILASLRASGKVFYLMSLAPLLAERMGDLSRLDKLAEDVALQEPHFMAAAHFILPVDATLDEMVLDVAEKARL